MKKELCDDAALIKKSLLAALSEEEEKELEKLTEGKELCEIYNQLKDPVFLKEQFVEYEKYSGKKGYEVFRDRASRIKRPRHWGYISGVAAVFVLVFATIIWYSANRGTVVPVIAVATDIPAGTKKARLILGDGSVVEMSEKNVNIEEKEEVQVKYQDGELSYKAKALVDKPDYHVLEVPRGGECFVTLNDGTKVWVNAGSKLRYPVVFTEECREVFLEGEAYFDVKKDERTFVVNTTLGKVRVLGTAFCVSDYPGDVACYTTLVCGKVSFQTQDHDPVSIMPGEQVVADESGNMRKREVDVNEYVGWKDEIYVFKEKKLEEIMKTLERWYDISIFFQDTSLREMPFTGDLKRYESISTLLNALVRTGDLQYKVEGRTVILYK